MNYNYNPYGYNLDMYWLPGTTNTFNTNSHWPRNPPMNAFWPGYPPMNAYWQGNQPSNAFWQGNLPANTYRQRNLPANAYWQGNPPANEQSQRNAANWIPQKTMAEVELERHALRVHGLNKGNDDKDDNLSDSSSGKSELDEEYYKFKPSPMVIDPKNVLVVNKDGSVQNTEKQIELPNQTLALNDRYRYQTPIFDGKNGVFTISDYKNDNSGVASNNKHTDNLPSEQYLTKVDLWLKNDAEIPKQHISTTNKEIIISEDEVAKQIPSRKTAQQITENMSTDITTPPHMQARARHKKTEKITENKDIGVKTPSQLPEKSTVSSEEEIICEVSGSKETQESSNTIISSTPINEPTQPNVSINTPGVTVVVDDRQDSEGQISEDSDSFWTILYKCVCCVS